MSQYIAYAPYVIWFSDPAEYAAAVASSGGNGYLHGPFAASVAFGITWPLVGGGVITGIKGIYGALPYGIPASPGPGYEVSHPNASGAFLKSDIDEVLVPGQGTNPPSGLTDPGPDMLLKWLGNIVFVNAQLGGSSPPPTAEIPKRRFICGCGEMVASGVEGTVGATTAVNSGSREASRTMEGMGLAIRGTNGCGFFERTVDEFYTPLSTKISWERFYIRVNALGVADIGIWRCKATTNSNAGAAIRINFTTGAFKIYSVSALSVFTLIATSTFIPIFNKWYLIDIILEFGAGGATDGKLRLYVNHVLDTTAIDNTGAGLDSNDTHAKSQFGQLTASEASWDIDLDDWMCADVPMIGAVESLTSIDWVLGTHIRRVDILSGTSVNYTGGGALVAAYYNNPTVYSDALSILTGTTALAQVVGLSDYVDAQVFPGITGGPASMWFGANIWNSLGQNARVGYNILSGANVYKTVAEDATHLWVGGMYLPTGDFLPTQIAPLSIIHEHPNSAATNLVKAYGANVEHVGMWGQEDDPLYPLDLSNNAKFLLHNSRYANLVESWFYSGIQTATVWMIGGTYVGNGTTTTITLPGPAHFIWIRPVGGVSTNSVKWFGSGLGGHQHTSSNFPPDYDARSFILNATGQSEITITGVSDANNAAGVTYQYVVFCDPGSRFNYCGAFTPVPAATTKTIPLFPSTFLPKAAFIQREAISGSGGSDTLTYKGTGNTANQGQATNGTNKANFGSFAIGSLTILTDSIWSTRAQSNFSLWRTTDNCGFTVVQITNYTGDATNPRDITLPISTGRWPLLAYVQPHGADGFIRDPSHAGTHSCKISNNSDSNAAIIGGGIDKITVQSTLNQLGVIYEVFVIMGDGAGWNNGAFSPPDCYSPDDYIQPIYAPPGGDPNITMDGGLNFNGTLSLLAIEDISGLYTLVPNKVTDTYNDGSVGGSQIVEIPDPTFKTGYIGG